MVGDNEQPDPKPAQSALAGSQLGRLGSLGEAMHADFGRQLPVSTDALSGVNKPE